MLRCCIVTRLQGLFHTLWRSLWLDISKGFISRNQVCSRKDPVLEREEALLQSRSDTFSRQKKSKVITSFPGYRHRTLRTRFRDIERSSSIFQCSLTIPTSPPPRKKYKSRVFRLGPVNKYCKTSKYVSRNSRKQL